MFEFGYLLIEIKLLNYVNDVVGEMIEVTSEVVGNVLRI